MAGETEKIEWPMSADIEFVERLIEQAPEALRMLLDDVVVIMRKTAQPVFKGIVDQQVLVHKQRTLVIDMVTDFYTPQRDVMRLLAFDGARKNPNEHVACLYCDSRCVVAFDRLQQRMECGDCESVMVWDGTKWDLEK